MSTDIIKYQDKIRAVVWSVCGSQMKEPDLRDIVQDVNLRLLSGALAQFDPARGEIQHFIRAVAANVAKDALRRLKYAQIPASDMLQPVAEGNRAPDGTEWNDACAALKTQDVDAQDDALAMLLREERKNLLDRVIKQLHPDDQHFLIISTREDYDNAAYAKRLGMTEIALRVRKHRLAEHIRSLLTAYRD